MIILTGYNFVCSVKRKTNENIIYVELSHGRACAKSVYLKYLQITECIEIVVQYKLLFNYKSIDVSFKFIPESLGKPVD